MRLAENHHFARFGPPLAVILVVIGFYWKLVLTDKWTWLAGPVLTLADLMAAAQLSAIDYLGDVPWDDHEGAKDWYARLKSRPSFRQILSDHVPGVAPPKHYPDLDF